MLRKNEKFILYAVIGGGAVVIDVGLFALLDSTTGLNILLSNTIAIGTAMLYSFGLNAKFNFKVTDNLFARFLSFAAVTAIGYIVSTSMLYLLSDVAGFPAILIKIASLPFVLVAQFMLNSRFTFNDKSQLSS